jgi:hypothetical protein
MSDVWVDEDIDVKVRYGQVASPRLWGRGRWLFFLQTSRLSEALGEGEVALFSTNKSPLRGSEGGGSLSTYKSPL